MKNTTHYIEYETFRVSNRQNSRKSKMSGKFGNLEKSEKILPFYLYFIFELKHGDVNCLSSQFVSLETRFIQNAYFEQVTILKSQFVTSSCGINNILNMKF